MKPNHERSALGIAATLLKQARRVLQHAQDAQASAIKLALDRVLPGLPAELEAPEPNEAQFFANLEQAFGEEFVKEARDGDQPEAAQPSANEAALQQQLSEMRKQQAELNEKFAKLLEAQKPQAEQQK